MRETGLSEAGMGIDLKEPVGQLKGEEALKDLGHLPVVETVAGMGTAMVAFEGIKTMLKTFTGKKETK